MANAPMTLAEFIAQAARPAPAAPVAPAAAAAVPQRHSYWFKSFQELVRDPEAQTELEEIKQAIHAENPRAGNRVNGFPSGFAPRRSFRFESLFFNDPEDAATRYFLLDGETGDIRISARRGDDLVISPELEARILTFLRTHARTSNAFNIRRHALEAFGSAQAAPSRRARRMRRTRRARKTRRSRK